MSYRDDVALAIRRAFQLGQTYWQQADSESYRENGKSDATLEKYRATLAETSEKAARADARIAELDQAVTVRDTEIARLETDLELARINAARYFWLRDDWYLSGTEDRCLDEVLDLSHRVTPAKMDAAIDAARAGNGGGV